MLSEPASREKFDEVWSALLEEVESRSREPAADHQAVWTEVEVGRVPTVACLHDLFSGPGEGYLHSVVMSLRKLRPQERALAALDVYNEGRQDMVRRIPQIVSVSRLELCAAAGIRGRLRRIWFRPSAKALRRVVNAALLRDSAARARLDGAFFLLLAKTVLSLLAPWRSLNVRWSRAGQDSSVSRPSSCWSRNRSPGLRIRPEAGRIAHIALHRRNLI